jgi:hypothetical protein
MEWLILVFAVVIFAAFVAIFAFIATLMWRQVQRYQHAVESVLPTFAASHEMEFSPDGSRDQLPRAEGTYEGVPMIAELYLSHAESGWDDYGRSRYHIVPSTRVTARSAAPMGCRFLADAGAQHEEGFRVQSADDSELAAARLASAEAEILAFAARRRGRITCDGAEVRVEWAQAEDDLEALEAGAALAARLVRE